MSGWRSGEKKLGIYSEKIDRKKNAKFQSSPEAIVWSLTLHSFSDGALWRTMSNVKSNSIENSRYIAALFSKI
jgi:hypothetical protein